MPVSGDTILRLVRAGEPAPYPSPRVVGIDDWAFRRGQSYGTIVCDLERWRVLDLLPERNADTVATWLGQHPGVEVVVRDRAGAYAEGARSGAPQAVQVADRWHLLRNLGDVMQGLVDRHRRYAPGGAKPGREGHSRRLSEEVDKIVHAVTKLVSQRMFDRSASRALS